MVRLSGIGRAILSLAMLVMSASASAGDVPLYEPVPDWVVERVATVADTETAGATFVYSDQQTKIEDGKGYFFSSSALKVLTPEMASFAGTFRVAWQPDTQDMVIHKVNIIREDETINVLADGHQLEVLRREQGLEQLMVDGSLTGILQIPGVQIGDILEIAYTTINFDPSRNGFVDGGAILPAQPLKIGDIRYRLIWPETVDLRWVADKNATPEESSFGKYRDVRINGLLPEPKDKPEALPARFQMQPEIRFTTFPDWSSVSKVLNALYEPLGSIDPDGNLQKQIDIITSKTDDPLLQMLGAIRLVQDDVRYLYRGMDNGNYTPQAPDLTWEQRFGDCKAKSLLLAAMLERLGIHAEIVLVNTRTGDAIPQLLPGFSPFDHVIVMARLNDKEYWIDGTRPGTRITNIDDAPLFHYGLPLTAQGSELVAIPVRAPTNPQINVSSEINLEAGLGYPIVENLEITARDEYYSNLKLAQSSMDDKSFNEMIDGFVGTYLNGGMIVTRKLSFDDDDGSVVISAKAIDNFFWQWEGNRYEAKLYTYLSDFDYDVDRTRAEWREIPISTKHPEFATYRYRISLPGHLGRFEIDGPLQFDQTIGGYELKYAISQDGSVLSSDNSSRTIAAEVPAENLAAIRVEIAKAQARPLRLIAPPEVISRSAQIELARRNNRLGLLKAVYDELVENAPDGEIKAFQNRANFRYGIRDYKGAVADISLIIELEPDAARYLWRANAWKKIDTEKALADIALAQQIEPASEAALALQVEIMMDEEDFENALSAVEFRSSLGVDRKRIAILRARILAADGKAADAIATLEEALASYPANTELFAARCRTKARYGLQLESVLRDCSRAVELDDSPDDALVDRAIAYWRMGREEDAAIDLDAALAINPDNAEARYVRGMLKPDDSGQRDIETAKLIQDDIAEKMKPFGLEEI